MNEEASSFAKSSRGSVTVATYFWHFVRKNFSWGKANGFGVSLKDFLKTLKVVVEFELIIKVSQVRMTFGTCVVAIVFNQTFPLCNI